MPPVTAAVASEDREVIVEGLAQIVAVLPPAEAAAAGLRLAAPFIQGVQQTATATAGEQVISSSIARTWASSMRACILRGVGAANRC